MQKEHLKDQMQELEVEQDKPSGMQDKDFHPLDIPATMSTLDIKNDDHFLNCPEIFPKLKRQNLSLVSSQCGTLPPMTDHPGHIVRARFRSPPERERVGLCILASLENSWLPVQGRATICDVSKMHPCSEPENFCCQTCRKEHITSPKCNHLSSPSPLSKEWEIPSTVQSGRIQLDDSLKKPQGPGLSPAVLPTVNSSQPIGMSGCPLDVPLVYSKDTAKVGFSSITFSTRVVPQATDIMSLEGPATDPGIQFSHDGRSAPDHTSATSSLVYALVDCKSKAVMYKRWTANRELTEHSPSYCSNHGVCEIRALEFGDSCTAGENNENAPSGFWQQDSSLEPSAQCTRWSCSCLEVSVNTMNSVLYLNRPLSVSLGRGNTEGSRAVLYRSTLSLRLQNTAAYKLALDTPGSGNESQRPGRPLSYPSMPGGLELKLGSPVPALVQQGTRLTDCTNSMGSASTVGCSSSGVLLPESSHLSPEAASQAVTSNKKTSQCQNNIESVQDTTAIAKVMSAENGDPMPGGQKEDVRGLNSARNVDHISDPPITDPGKSSWEILLQKGAPNGLTLRDALQLFRPDFIIRSRGRMKLLEQHALERRSALPPGSVKRVTHGPRGRNCTKPHPLSDNLFKPKERVISGKEMQRRSKRMYNKLPEVMKKKEEEEKKVVSQTNRLRAELYKKKLLEQILQRNHD